MYALIRLYAELHGELIQARRNEVLIRGDIEHVKAVLRMLEPGINLAAIKPRRKYRVNPVVKRRGAFRAALEVLAEANEPLATKELARRVLIKLGVSEPDMPAIRKMFGAIYATLRKREGETVQAYRETKPMRWALL
ncbi:MAG: hypothetical protein ACHQF3_07380 [Alphaproteobacteria bacterium]